MAKSKTQLHVSEFPKLRELRDKHGQLTEQLTDVRRRMNEPTDNLRDDAEAILASEGGLATAVMSPRVDLERDEKRLTAAIEILERDQRIAKDEAKRAVWNEAESEVAEACLAIARALVDLHSAQASLLSVQSRLQERGAPLPGERVQPLLADAFQQTLRLPQLETHAMRRSYRQRLRFIATSIPPLAEEVSHLIEQIQ